MSQKTHMKKGIAAFAFAAALSLSAHGTTIYVHPDGSDRNPGSVELPLKSLQVALDHPGYDTLMVMDGTYVINEPVRMHRSGSPGNTLVIMAQNQHRAVIDADNYLVEPASGRTPSRSGKASLHFGNVRHILVDGLRVINSHGMGIALAHGSSYITLRNCRVEDSFNSGIGLWYSDHVKVLHCEVTGANRKALKTASDRVGREAPHEAITIAGATNFEVAFNEVHHCDKEGIDCKEVSAHGIIHHNYMHDLPRQGLYVDCWFGLLEDVEFSHNRVHDCEWGMAISGEGKDASMRNIRIHHNLLYDNRGSGVFFGVWGNDELRDSIFIFNNTIVNNGSRGHWAGPVGGIDIRSTKLTNTFIYNNICHNNHSFEVGCSLDDPARTTWQQDNNIIVTHNHSGIYKSIPDPPGAYGSVYAFLGEAPSGGDPGFSAAPGFVLSPGSPAFRKGWSGAPFGRSLVLGH